MIPAPFDYVRPESVSEAVAHLARHGDEAKVLAGGHSLLPLMKLRLAFPELLVDVGRIPALRGVRQEADTIVVGAATTHHDVLHDPLLRDRCGLVADAIAVVADPQVRHRGTLGGALAHGDAAGDLPAVALALDATFVAEGPAGRREIPAADFFKDYLETALSPDELLVEVRFPMLSRELGWRYHYEKFARASHMWAVVGAAVAVRLEGEQIAEARVGLTNMATVPVRAATTEAALMGAGSGDVDAAAAVADAEADPGEDLNATPEYRRHLARVLTRRALHAAIG